MADARSDSLRANKAHGYVYAFFHSDLGWLKVGMTDNSDSFACWSRIKNYAESHGLTKNGWELVTFVPVRDPISFERRLHRDLRHMLVDHGKAKELFTCSPDFFAGILLSEKNQKYLDLKSASPNERVRKIQAKREEVERKLLEDAQREMAMDLRKSRSNAAARKRHKDSHKDSLESTKAIREQERDLHEKLDSKTFGQFGYGILNLFLIFSVLPSRVVSIPLVVSAALGAAIMCLLRRSQSLELEKELLRVRDKIPPEPKLVIPFPEVEKR